MSGEGSLVWGTYDWLFIMVPAKAWLEEHWALYGRLELQHPFLSLSKFINLHFMHSSLLQK